MLTEERNLKNAMSHLSIFAHIRGIMEVPTYLRLVRLECCKTNGVYIELSAVYKRINCSKNKLCIELS